MSKQKIIAFEGIDGSGKTVQFKLLCDYLQSIGKNVNLREYPVYTSKFGEVIGEFLSGKRRLDANQVDARSMALWFAMDRFEDLRSQPLEDSDYLLINRYVLSNIVYQSIRSDDPDYMRKWIYDLEHVTLNLPIPDAYVFFDIEEDQAGINVLKKGHRAYVGHDKDVYEASGIIQSSARQSYLECARQQDNIIVVSCMEKGTFLPQEIIAKKVIEGLNGLRLL